MDNDQVFRDSWRTPKLWIVDAKVWLFLVIFLFFPHIWSLCLLIAFLILIAISQQVFRYDLVSSMRAVRARLYGPYRAARPVNRRNRVLDYGGVPHLNLFEDTRKK